MIFILAKLSNDSMTGTCRKTEHFKALTKNDYCKQYLTMSVPPDITLNGIILIFYGLANQIIVAR